MNADEALAAVFAVPDSDLPSFSERGKDVSKDSEELWLSSDDSGSSAAVGGSSDPDDDPDDDSAFWTQL